MLARRLHINIKNSTPVWQQIEQGVKELIMAGVLSPGELVISVRELAKQLRVNPELVAKAYNRLADAGVFSIDKWSGEATVAELPKESSHPQIEVLRKAARRYAAVAISVGASFDESVVEFSRALGRKLLQEGTIRFDVRLSDFKK